VAIKALLADAVRDHFAATAEGDSNMTCGVVRLLSLLDQDDRNRL
jgi:hypothetical protein